MQYQCQVCKNVFPEIPEKCPICNAPKEKFTVFTPAAAKETITPDFVNVLEKLQMQEGAVAKIVNIKTEQLGADTYYFAPGQVLAYHKHPESDQIFFILSGTGKFYLDPGEEKVFDVVPGMIILAPRDVWHQLINTGDVPLVASQVTKLPVTSVPRK